ncbi:hypothetical protein [Pseudomonas sp. N040]|uniref:hypothetical protein n=1 Tax=Pseudomonas sp. N040 TaxID=2785325 RepID=UPI0018A32356|nr:hypothetical protein [Pseudomonas sp. N040]MBF7729191.1 hypothetical protein [Pseudomonas sp. N040]MBW7012831.1 hypothetical protein [Pseudomonas sp. N040]
MELYANNPSRREMAAKIHAWSDPLFELPAVSVILLSGLWMLSRVEHVSALLWLKIALGGGAILINYWCYSFVFRRARDSASDEQRIHWTRCIAWTGLAIPPAIAAFMIGKFLL